jgi:hypothetical protein
VPAGGGVAARAARGGAGGAGAAPARARGRHAPKRRVVGRAPDHARVDPRAQRRRVAVGHRRVLAVARRLEHRAREVAQRGARRGVERVAAGVGLLEPVRQAARLDRGAVQVARVQVAEGGVVVREQPLVVAGHVRQRAVVGRQRERAARHALRVAVVGRGGGALEGERALVPPRAVVGRRAAVELAEERVRRAAVALAPGLPERRLPAPAGERVAQPLLGHLQPRRRHRERPRERPRRRRAAAGRRGQRGAGGGPHETAYEAAHGTARGGAHGRAGGAYRPCRSRTMIRCCARAIASASLAFAFPTASMRCSSSDRRKRW